MWVLTSQPPFLSGCPHPGFSFLYLNTKAAPSSLVLACPLESILYLTSQRDLSKNDKITLLLKTLPRLSAAQALGCYHSGLAWRPAFLPSLSTPDCGSRP